MARRPRSGPKAARTRDVPLASETGVIAYRKPAEDAPAPSMGRVSSHHPDYDARVEEWQLMRDASRGASAVKAAGERWLPKPPGFGAQADKGKKMYEDYVLRAQFPDITLPTIMAMVGIIHRMEAKIEMPEAMEDIWENATKDGLTLEAFHRQITFELLHTGRYGVLTEARPATEGGSEIPYLCGYTAESIINWSKDRDLFVLDESGPVRNGFEWVEEPKWRVLMKDENGNYVQQIYRGQNEAKVDETADEEVQPTARGMKELKEIPFVTIGTRTLNTEPEDPPLLGVGRSAISAYQLSADYRHQLYMTGQETLFCFNMDQPDLVGSGVVVAVSTAEGVTPDAKYVSPTGSGIAAHKDAIQDELQVAAKAGARLFGSDDGGSSQESGEARRMRYTAETATLTSIALTSAQGLEKALKNVAVMMGLNPDDIVVVPNLKFINTKLTFQELTALVKAWQDGAISYETLYENLQKGEVASAERDAEAELKLIDDETDDLKDPAAAGVLPKPNAPPANPNAPPQNPPVPGNTPANPPPPPARRAA